MDAVAEGREAIACQEGSISDSIEFARLNEQLYARNDRNELVQVYRCPQHATDDCPDGLICAKTGNPNYGILNFDNILWAWLTIFQVISMEGWTNVMYTIQDAISQISWIYFFILIIVGSFFAVNLAFAVLYLQFTSGDSRPDGAEGSSESSVDDLSSTTAASLDIPVTSQHWLRVCCYQLQDSTVMEILTMTLIVINVGVMAADHHGMPKWQETMAEIINTIIAVYFLIEMVIKIVGLGWRGYISDRMHLFDGVVALAGMIELLIVIDGAISGVGGSLYVFRIFRLLRIFKLSRSWNELHKIVGTIHGSIASMANLCLIFFLFIIVMALLGMQLFGFRMQFCAVAGAQSLCPPGRHCPDHPDCYFPCRSDQKDQWFSITGSPYNDMAYCEEFDAEVLSHQFWAQVGSAYVPRHNFDTFFWAFLTAFQILTGENWNEVMYDVMRSTSYFAASYCIVIIIIGNYILLNLFLAILLDHFAGLDGNNVSAENEMPHEAQAESLPETESTVESVESLFISTESSVQDVHIQCSRAPSSAAASEDTLSPEAHLVGHALMVFSPTHPLRWIIHRVVSHRFFERLIVFLILCSSISMAMESPSLDESSSMGRLVRISDSLFVLLFGIEAALKIVAFGFLFNGPGSYLRDRWNVLDFVILLVGLIFQIRANIEELKSIRVLRVLRCLRPLRLASRFKGLKVVVHSLLQSIPPLLNVALVCLLFFFTFAILGINLLKVQKRAQHLVRSLWSY